MTKYFEHNPRFFASLPRAESILQDHTATKIFKECARKYFYRIVLGYRPHSNKNQTILDFGKAYHKFREVLELSYLSGKSREECFGAAIKAASKIPITPASPNSKWAYLDEGRLALCMQVAFEYWCKEKDQKRIKVVAVEQPVNCQLPDGSYVAGRADQIVEWNGLLWGRDFKNTSKPESQFVLSTEPNDQASRYIHIESRVHGTDIEGIIFECIYHTKTVKPTINPIITQRTKWQRDQWVKEQMFWNKRMQASRDEDVWPMREDDYACAWCEFHNVCTKPTEAGAQAALVSQFKHAPWDFNTVEQEGD